MGNCCGGLTEEQKASKKMDLELKREKAKANDIYKLLLLGAGESGKSTLFKQMKILYTEEKGFSKSVRAGYVPVVHNNVLGNMQKLLEGCDVHTPATDQEAAKVVLAYDFKTQVIDSEVAATLKAVWNDPGVQDTWNHRSNIQVQDALEFYMGEIDTIAASDYLPSNQDILRTRVRTSGIVEEQFDVKGAKIVMYDVGGQRNERRKWMHKFDGVNAVIFVSAISEYDQMLFEKNTVNRQDESLELFQTVYNSDYFSHLSFILFLNKEDIFREKLPVFPFRIEDGPNARNVDFAGPYCTAGEPSGTPGTPEFEECVEAAKEYMKELYRQLKTRKEPMYIHVTDATNSTNMDKIMSAVRDNVLRANLENTGFMVSGAP